MYVYSIRMNKHLNGNIRRIKIIFTFEIYQRLMYDKILRLEMIYKNLKKKEKEKAIK